MYNFYAGYFVFASRSLKVESEEELPEALVHFFKAVPISESDIIAQNQSPEYIYPKSIPDRANGFTGIDFPTRIIVFVIPGVGCVEKYSAPQIRNAEWSKNG